jgi:hypothetical protein
MPDKTATRTSEPRHFASRNSLSEGFLRVYGHTTRSKFGGSGFDFQLQCYRRRSGNGSERPLHHVTTGFCEKPAGSSYPQTTNTTNSEITSQANVLVSIATQI